MAAASLLVRNLNPNRMKASSLARTVSAASPYTAASSPSPPPPPPPIQRGVEERSLSLWPTMAAAVAGTARIHFDSIAASVLRSFGISYSTAAGFDAFEVDEEVSSFVVGNANRDALERFLQRHDVGYGLAAVEAYRNALKGLRSNVVDDVEQILCDYGLRGLAGVVNPAACRFVSIEYGANVDITREHVALAAKSGVLANAGYQFDLVKNIITYARVAGNKIHPFIATGNKTSKFDYSHNGKVQCFINSIKSYSNATKPVGAVYCHMGSTNTKNTTRGICLSCPLLRKTEAGEVTVENTTKGICPSCPLLRRTEAGEVTVEVPKKTFLAVIRQALDKCVTFVEIAEQSVDVVQRIGRLVVVVMSAATLIVDSDVFNKIFSKDNESEAESDFDKYILLWSL